MKKTEKYDSYIYLGGILLKILIVIVLIMSGFLAGKLWQEGKEGSGIEKLLLENKNLKSELKITTDSLETYQDMRDAFHTYEASEKQNIKSSREPVFGSMTK